MRPSEQHKPMEVTEFIKLVHMMREKQCNYFANKCITNLLEAKELERRVDEELATYAEVKNTHTHTPTQAHTPTLF